MAASTECPKCGSDNSGTTDSRNTVVVGHAVRRRRRKCYRCLHLFTTYEMTADVMEQIEAAMKSHAALVGALARIAPAIEAAVGVRTATKIMPTMGPKTGRKEHG